MGGVPRGTPNHPFFCGMFHEINHEINHEAIGDHQLPGENFEEVSKQWPWRHRRPTTSVRREFWRGQRVVGLSENTPSHPRSKWWNPWWISSFLRKFHGSSTIFISIFPIKLAISGLSPFSDTPWRETLRGWQTFLDGTPQIAKKKTLNAARCERLLREM